MFAIDTTAVLADIVTAGGLVLAVALVVYGFRQVKRLLGG